jgi:hypothetical protein
MQRVEELTKTWKLLASESLETVETVGEQYAVAHNAADPSKWPKVLAQCETLSTRVRVSALQSVLSETLPLLGDVIVRFEAILTKIRSIVDRAQQSFDALPSSSSSSGAASSSSLPVFRSSVGEEELDRLNDVLASLTRDLTLKQTIVDDCRRRVTLGLFFSSDDDNDDEEVLATYCDCWHWSPFLQS